MKTKLDTKAAAEYLGLSTGTLVNWRSNKKQLIPYFQFNSRVLYAIEDLDAYQAKCKRDDIKTT